MEIYAGLI